MTLQPPPFKIRNLQTSSPHLPAPSNIKIICFLYSAFDYQLTQNPFQINLRFLPNNLQDRLVEYFNDSLVISFGNLSPAMVKSYASVFKKKTCGNIFAIPIHISLWTVFQKCSVCAHLKQSPELIYMLKRDAHPSN